MTSAVKTMQTYFSAFGAALPSPTKFNRGRFALKRATSAEDELYVAVADSSNTMQYRRILTKTYGDTLYNPIISSGAGSPEGVVTGAVGDLYRRTDVSAADIGQQLFVKVSGSGNTGWLSVTKAPRRRTVREILTYEGASTSGSFVSKGFQNTPTITANASANADASTGPFLQHTTTSSSGNVASVVAGTNSGVRFDWQCDVSFGIRTPNDITSIRHWHGLFASSPSGSDDPAIEGFGFRFSTNASDANWQAWSNDGVSTGTVTDTGIVYNGNSGYELRAIVVSDTQINFYINGARVVSHTTNLPATTTVLNYGIYLTTLSANTRSFRWGRITLEHES